MSKIITAGVALFTIIFIGLMMNEESYASTIDDIRILKISGQDQRAVIKDSDGKTRVIKPGDPIGKSGKVMEIAAGRVVVEEQKDAVVEKVIIRLEDGRQRVERIRKIGEKQPQLFAPQSGREQSEGSVVN